MKYINRDKIIIGALILIFAIYGYYNNPYIKDNLNLNNDIITINQDLDDSDLESNIFVHIDGEVINPGLYEMKNTDRINDIINLAGGLTEEASTANINLAQKLTDEMKIYISKESTNDDLSVNSEKLNSKLININIASKEELLSLPGIGDTKANAIIKYRESNTFIKLEDIMNVTGIGEKTFESLKELISIY